MANKNRNEIHQPRTGEGEKQSPRAGEANKLNKRSEVVRPSFAEQNLATAEARVRAFGPANGQLKESLSWPLGY